MVVVAKGCWGLNQICHMQGQHSSLCTIARGPLAQSRSSYTVLCYIAAVQVGLSTDSCFCLSHQPICKLFLPFSPAAGVKRLKDTR